MKGYLTVEQTAKQLGVSAVRVGQLIRDGRLDADKFAGAWAIEKASVDKQRELTRGHGVSRAMSASTLWALAALVDGKDGEDATGVTASTRYKLRRRAREVKAADQVRRWAESRYIKTLTLSMAQDAVDQLMSDARAVRTGVSAESTIVGDRDEVEVVVHEDDVEDVIDDNELEEYFDGDAKATVHVVASGIASRLRTRTDAWRLVVALDLADSDNGRTRDLGRRQIEQLIREMKTL